LTAAQLAVRISGSSTVGEGSATSFVFWCIVSCIAAAAVDEDGNQVRPPFKDSFYHRALTVRQLHAAIASHCN